MKSKNYVALFLVTMATLMFEITLTRIFSATTWYHFAFMAISIAMFGMTAGSIVVYLFPKFFNQEKANYHMSMSSLLFCITIISSFLLYLYNPIGFKSSNSGLQSVIFNFISISIPFFFSGICVSTALTKFPRFLCKLYAVDLAGAALGCIAFIIVLNLTDGPTTIFITAFLALIASIIFFEFENSSINARKILSTFAVLLAAFISINLVKSYQQDPVIKMFWGKGKISHDKLYEKWNSFSYIQVVNPDIKSIPAGYGLSEKSIEDYNPIEQLELLIDTGASTLITKFDGDLSKLKYLKNDITNFVHYLKDDANIAIIGTGGGRDVLAALVFNQNKVTGIEINENIINIVQGKFGDFSGHLYSNPKVKIVNDEARSYISRSEDHFDIIQASLVDTSAATAAGAFVLTENSLYTVEAWKTFIEHLNDKGILTFSRWYSEKNPAEIYRLTSLARKSLVDSGVSNPEDHIIIVCKKVPNLVYGIGTILVSKTPFTDEDIKKTEESVKRLGFEILFHPKSHSDEVIANIVYNYDKFNKFLEAYPYDISPSTDDRPFFFNMFKFSNFSKGVLPQKNSATWFDNQAIVSLLFLFVIVSILMVVCIFVPLIIKRKNINLIKVAPYLTYFASIGFGFILIEISQLQRLTIFLGHPVYSLSVVLFTLLLASGIGSFLTSIFREKENFNKISIIVLMSLIVSLIVFGLLTPYATELFKSSTNFIRILISILIMFPIGIFMGTAFPIGMKISSNYYQDLTPWLWGINGAASVCASVLAVIIAMIFGINIAFWTGVAFYICMIFSFILYIAGAKSRL